MVLKNPTPGSLLSPLDTSQVAALNNVLELLTAILPVSPTTADAHANDGYIPISTSTPDAPRLRVAKQSPGGHQRASNIRRCHKKAITQKINDSSSTNTQGRSNSTRDTAKDSSDNSYHHPTNAGTTGYYNHSNDHTGPNNASTARSANTTHAHTTR
jgi:hypothetical protein